RPGGGSSASRAGPPTSFLSEACTREVHKSDENGGAGGQGGRARARFPCAGFGAAGHSNGRTWVGTAGRQSNRGGVRGSDDPNRCALELHGPGLEGAGARRPARGG